MDGDRAQPQVFEGRLGELGAPAELLQLCLSEEPARKGGSQHVEDERFDPGLDGVRRQPDAGELWRGFRGGGGHVGARLDWGGWLRQERVARGRGGGGGKKKKGRKVALARTLWFPS